MTAREVLDSRGRPTVEVDVRCDGDHLGRAIVPSGASTGRHEALELRDGDASRHDGAGVRKAVANVRGEIATALIGQDAADQNAIDRLLLKLDGTPNKSRLGANAILGASMAAARAAAEAQSVSLVQHLRGLWHAQKSSKSKAALSMPLPMVNMISGGLHAGGNLDLQDFLAIPVGAESYSQALDWIVTVYRRLGTLLTERGYEGTLVGDEGGYGPRLRENREALELLTAAIERARLRPGEQMAIGLDVASTHFYEGGRYRLRTGGQPTTLTSEEMVELLAGWVDDFPIVSIEDGCAEDDWKGWQVLTQRLGDRVQLIGDDLFVTDAKRLQRGIESKVANSVLIKLNQVGTLTETLETMRLAIANGYAPVVSARSGETEDAFIADFAVATGAGQIKIGSIARSERLAKYNQLLRLEEELGASAPFAGRAALAPRK